MMRTTIPDTPARADPQDLFARGMLPAGPETLPPPADPLLVAPQEDLCASRLWYETTLRHALPEGSQAWLACVGPIGSMAVPLLEVQGRIESLTTPHTLTWRPLVASWAGPVAMEAAAVELGKLLRRWPPVLLKAMEADEPTLAPLRAGLRRAGLSVQSFAHFGNWHEALPVGTGWNDYVASRDLPLRSVLQQKRTAWEVAARFDLCSAPGEALEAGIAAFQAVSAPGQASPAFDVALMRAAADRGLLRLGVLRARGDGRPLAAQYWMLSGGWATMMRFAHDRTMQQLSPCTDLTARMVASLIAEGVSGLDFGRGDEAYKRLWARHRRQRIGLLVANPLHASGLLALVRHAAGRQRRRLLNLFGRRTPAERGR
jgi:hypothetical protein